MESIAMSVVELNNLGLSHFLSGDYQNAVDSLWMACHAIDRYSSFQHSQCGTTTMADETVKCPQQHCASMEEDQVSSCMDQYMLQILRKSPPSKNPEPCNFAAASSNNLHSFYNRGLVMSADQCNHMLTKEYIHRTSAVILYNLALVYHNMGVRQGISAALPHALKMYESAFDCLRKVTCIVECHKLLLAILNNMGNIYAQALQVDHTLECFQKLQQALSIPNPSMAVDEDYVFFLLNALFQPKELSFAPAA